MLMEDSTVWIRVGLVACVIRPLYCLETRLAFRVIFSSVFVI
jgi:hypothetical protein